MIDVEDHQGYALMAHGQDLFEQAGEGMAVEDLGQAVQVGGQVGALQLAAQVEDFVLGRAQALEEALLFLLHLVGALLQVVEHVRQVVDDRLVQRGEALVQALLVGLVVHQVARYVAFDVLHQLDRLSLAGTGLFELAVDDVLAEQLERGIRREGREVLDGLFHPPVQIGVLALAIGVPEGVVHRVGRDVVAHHQRDRLLEQGGRFAGFFRVEVQDARGFRRLLHSRHCGGVWMGRG
ncbi:hypothetical protein D9M69_381160 [compost metagenome]